MSDLVAVSYPDVATAPEVLNALDRLQVERAVDLDDAVIVERDADGRVTVSPLDGSRRAGDCRGALVGGLIGTLSLAPLLGAALGAAAGATRAALVDLGIWNESWAS